MDTSKKNPQETLKRFLVENFYKDDKKKARLEIEETHIDDFVVINIISPECLSYNFLLLSLMRIYRDLR